MLQRRGRQVVLWDKDPFPPLGQSAPGPTATSSVSEQPEGIAAHQRNGAPVAANQASAVHLPALINAPAARGCCHQTQPSAEQAVPFL